MQKEPFSIAVSDATLADLRERLLKTRCHATSPMLSGSTTPTWSI